MSTQTALEVHLDAQIARNQATLDDNRRLLHPGEQGPKRAPVRAEIISAPPPPVVRWRVLGPILSILLS
jgi:hypothetical protein